MSVALIDNATLTGVQRLLGVAETRSRDAVDGDIAALENLLEAILFYDDIFCIDNYKAEYRDHRHKIFPFINFLAVENHLLDKVEIAARAEAASFKPAIVSGEFESDFQEFLKLLRMHMVCTWDVSGSVYYLTMKMLGQPDTPEFAKYGQLSASIFSELADQGGTIGPNPYRKPCRLVDSQGNPIGTGYRVPNATSTGGETGGMTKSLEVFVAALNWLSFKSIYYTLAARSLKADVFLYPIRQAFQQHWLRRVGAYDTDFVSGVLDRLANASLEEAELILSAAKPYVVKFSLPFFAASLVTKTRDIRQVISEAYVLRDKSPFKSVRSRLSDLRYSFDNGSSGDAIKEVNKICADVENNLRQIRAEFNAGSPRGIPARLLLQVYNGVAWLSGLPSVPEIDVSLKLPHALQGLRDRSGFTTLYRSIVRDLTDIPRLGEARDLPGAHVRLKDDGASAYSPKAEEPRFRHTHSSWKSPM